MVVFKTSVGIEIIHWLEGAYFLYIALFSYGLALFGYLARKMRWRNWLPKHIGGMAGSYIGILTAVLVVNGTDIPFVNHTLLLVWFVSTLN